MLANTLQAVVSQTLLQRSDQAGMIPAIGIMICNSAVRNWIRDSRICEIPNIIETGQRLGMQSLDQSIGQILSHGYISPDQALAKCQDATRMQNLCSVNSADWS